MKDDDDDDDDNNNNNNNNKRGKGWNEVEKNFLVTLVQCWYWNINRHCVSREFIASAACDVT